METKVGVKVQNWKRSITSYPSVVVYPENVNDIVSVIKDPEKYPSPIRAVRSNHSTTRCGVADKGTVLNMSKMNRIIEIGEDTVTAEAGALYIDVAKELEKQDLQFYVNVELGNLSIGSAACGGTKDASMPGEFGQVCSYAIGMKLVLPSGELLEVTEDDPELLRVMRSSYGLLGVIYEATFKVKKLRPLDVEHITYTLDQFIEKLPVLKAREESMMLFLLPFLNKIIVEYRKHRDDVKVKKGSLVWRVRNWVWKTVAPGFGAIMTKIIPIKSLRYALIDRFNLLIQTIISALLRSPDTSPTDQLIRYPDKAALSAYTFSIWAFPEEKYPEVLRGYFEFCRDYYRNNGYRCDMLNVGYRIKQDTSSLFSYSSKGDVMTLDPVSTGSKGWDGFITAYNQYCSERGGVPLFNQTRAIRPYQASLAFGETLKTFAGYRKKYDPTNRLLNEYFKQILEWRW